MKKLMIAAAAAAIVGAAQAATPIPVPCVDPTDMCEPAVFKLTASGKLSMNMGSYKTVQSLKVSKGLLVAKRQIGQICGTEVVEVLAPHIDNDNVTYTQTKDIPVAATNMVNFDHTNIRLDNKNYNSWETDDFWAAKTVAQKFATLAEAQAAFAGATMDVIIQARDAAENTLAETRVEKFYTIDPLSIVDLDDVYYYGTTAERQGECIDVCEDCYDCADIYVNVKAGKANYALKYTDVELLKWSVFGKNFAKFEDAATQLVPIKYSYKLETEMALRAEDYAGSDIVDSASLYMVAFGDATLKQFASTSGKGLCADGVCKPETSSAFKLNGWFVGWYDDLNGMPDEAQYTCDACGGYLYGGTWSATYDEKLSASFTGDADAESYMGKEIADYIE